MPVNITEQDGVTTIEVDDVPDLETNPTKPQKASPDTGLAGLAEKVFTGWMEGRLTDSKNLMQDTYHKEWDRFLGIDAGKSPWTGSVHSRIHVPVLKKAKETILKNMRQGLFPNESNWFDVDPVSMGDEKTAQANRQYLEWQLAQVNFVHRMSDEALDMGATLGTTIVRTLYRRRTRNVRRVRSVMEPTTDDFGAPVENDFTEKRIVTRKLEDLGGVVDFRIVNPQSFYPFQTEGVERIRDLTGFIETGVVSWGQVSAREERVEVYEHEGIRRRQTVGVYKNVDQIRRDRAQNLHSTGVENEDNSTKSKSGNTTASEVWGFPWREVWFKIPLTDILLQGKDSEGNPTVKPAVLAAFMKKWGITKSDLDPNGGGWVAEMVDGVLVRIERNPAPFEDENEVPYLSWQYKRRPGHLFGIGIYEQLEKMQIAIDAFASGGLDASIKNVYPMYVFDQSAFDSRDGAPNDMFAYEPYRAIPKRAGRSLKEAVETFAPDQGVIQTAAFSGKQMEEAARDLSGATAELEGVAGGGRKTATEISQVSSAALASVNFLNSRAEQALLAPMLRQFVDYNQAFASPHETIRVIGEDAQEMFVEITGDVLRRARVDVRPKGTTELTNRFAQGQTTVNVWSLLRQTGRLKDEGWIEVIMRQLGMRENPKKMVMDNAEFKKHQEMLAQVQAAAGEEATVDNGGGPQQVPTGQGAQPVGGGF